MKQFIPAAAVAAALLVGVSLAGAASTTTLKASLSGKTEVPDKGDPDGKGNATVRITGKKVCWTFSYSKIDAPVAAHIHKGARGKAGAVVVPFFGAPPAKRTGCVNAKSAVAAAIAKNPGRYYVNLHSKRFPGGVLRGQLHK